MKKLFFTAAAAAIILCGGSAEARLGKHNTVIQSYKEISNTNIFEPGFNPAGYDARIKAQEKENSSVIAVSDPNEKPVDYNKEMAESLFAQPDLSPLSIEVSDKQNKTSVHIGQPLQIILPEGAAAKWHYENNFKHIEIIEDYNFQGQRILNAAVKDKGKEKIYFDLIEDNGKEIKVLESRILNITVE